MAKDKNTRIIKDTDIKRKSLEEVYKIPKKDLVPKEGSRQESPGKSKTVDRSRFESIAKATMGKIEEATAIKELLPDVVLAEEIIVSTTLSPKDSTPAQLEVMLDRNAPGGIAEAIVKHLTTEYDLESKFPDIIGEALFSIGSFSLIALPVKSISNIINDNNITMESFSESHVDKIGDIQTGWLPSKDISTDAGKIIADFSKLINDKTPIDLIEISDNPIELLRPITTAVLNKKRDQDTMTSLGFENYDLTVKGSGDDVYLKRAAKRVERLLIKEAEDVDTTLNPIVLNPPAESVIPVHVPGEPDNHVGYYLVTNASGEFVHTKRNKTQIAELNRQLEQLSKKNASDFNVITSSLSVNSISYNTDKDKDKMSSTISDAYYQILEERLQEATRSSNGETLEVNCTEDIYRTMFTRQLARQKTRLIYVPATMLTYFAFNYDEMGRGVSLLEKTKVYAALRGMLMFSDIISGVENSIPGKKVNITLDADDPDQQKTVETAIAELLAMQSNVLSDFPLTPADITSAIYRGNLDVEVDGGEVYPDTKLTMEHVERQRPKADGDLDERLRVLHYMGLGVPPEKMDRKLEGDFAEGLIQSDQIETKRVLTRQDVFCRQASSFIRQYILAGGPLLDTINKILDESKTKLTFDEILDSIKVKLPRPDTVIIEQQKQSFDNYSDLAELVVESYFNEESLGLALSGDYLEEGIEVVRSAVLDLLKRQYVKNQNILPELQELFIDGEYEIDKQLADHAGKVTDVVHKLLIAIKKDEWRKDLKVEKTEDKVSDDRDAAYDDGEDDEQDSSDVGDTTDADVETDAESEEDTDADGEGTAEDNPDATSEPADDINSGFDLPDV